MRKRIIWDEHGQKKVFDGEKATPELLAEHMRKLPGHKVTKEIAEEGKVHELDPGHVRRTISREIDEAEVSKKTPVEDEKLETLPLDEYIPIEQISKRRLQREISISKMSTMSALCGTVMCGGAKLADTWHVWFPVDRKRGKRHWNYQELRDGPAPPDFARPKELRGIDLDIRLTEFPDEVRDLLTDRGHSIREIDRLLKDWHENAEAGIEDEEAYVQ